MQLTTFIVLSLVHFTFAAPATSRSLQARDDWDSGKYGDASWYSAKYSESSRYDDDAWYPSKYSDGSQYDDGSWYSGNYPDGSQYDDDHYGYKDKCPSRNDAIPFQQNRYPDGIGASSTIGYFFRSKTYNAVPLYKTYKEESKDYFYTTSEDSRRRIISEGYSDQGIAGYVYPSGTCGCVPLYKLYNSKSYQHFYTTSWEEKEKAVKIGYEYKGMEGYVYEQ